MTNRLLKTMTAALAALSLSQAALASNTIPFPRWDLNAPAFQRAHDLFLLISENETRLPVTDLEDRAILSRGEEALFNDYLTVQTNSRNYLTAHWHEYSTYAILRCIGFASVEDPPQPARDWPTLVACLTQMKYSPTVVYGANGLPSFSLAPSP